MTVNYTIPKTSDIVSIISGIQDQVNIFVPSIILMIGIIVLIMTYKMTDSLSIGGLVAGTLGMIFSVFFLAIDVLDTWRPLIISFMVIIVSIIGIFAKD